MNPIGYNTPEDPWAEGVQKAIESVSNAWDHMYTAKSLHEVVQAFPKMADAVSDLKTWHARFDLDQGDILPEEEAAVQLNPAPA